MRRDYMEPSIETLFVKKAKKEKPKEEGNKWLKQFKEERLYDKVSQKTLDTDLSRLDIFLTFCKERLRKEPNKLTTKDFISFFNYLDTERGISLNTQDKYFKLLKVFYRYFKLNNIGEFIKESMERGRFRRIDKKHYDAITADEFDKVLKKIIQSRRKCKERDILLYRFLWDTGARAGEVLDIKFKDVDLEEGIFKLRKTKTKEERTVVCAKNTLAFLKHHVMFNISQSPDAYLFQNDRGKKVRRDHLSKLFKWAVDELKKEGKIAKNRDLVLHSVRHGFITRMLDSGVPLEVISAYVGHSTINTTMIYAHAKERVGIHMETIKSKINEVR
jgi:integrase/recombinase XerD